MKTLLIFTVIAKNLFLGCIAQASEHKVQIKSPLAEVMMTLIHGQDFSMCQSDPPEGGEFPRMIACEVNGLKCSATYDGVSLDATFPFVIGANCVHQDTKKTLNENLAKGITSILSSIKVDSNNTQEEENPTSTLTREWILKSLKCESYLANPEKSLCTILMP